MKPRTRPSSLGRLAESLGRRPASPGNIVATKSIARNRRLPDASDVAVLPSESTPMTDILRKSRVQSRPARVGNYLHVSDLIGKCIRKKALAERYNQNPVPQPISITDATTYAQGDAIHDAFRDRAVHGGPEQVWGNWACKCGTTKTEEPCTFSELDHKVRCKACGKALNEYQEVPMFNKEHMIVGNPDLLFYLPGLKAFYVNELKSISHEQWKDLARPLPEHVVQVVFYWYLMRAAGYRVANRVSVIYVSKGWKFSGDIWKEFSVDATKEVHRLEPYLAAAKAFIAARAGGELPERTCRTETDTTARSCSASASCFHGGDAKPVVVDIGALSHRPAARTRNT